MFPLHPLTRRPPRNPAIATQPARKAVVEDVKDEGVSTGSKVKCDEAHQGHERALEAARQV